MLSEQFGEKPMVVEMEFEGILRVRLGTGSVHLLRVFDDIDALRDLKSTRANTPSNCVSIVILFGGTVKHRKQPRWLPFGYIKQHAWRGVSHFELLDCHSLASFLCGAVQKIRSRELGCSRKNPDINGWVARQRRARMKETKCHPSDQISDRRQRLVEPRRIATSRLREVGTPAAGATDHRRDLPDDLARLYL